MTDLKEQVDEFKLNAQRQYRRNNSDDFIKGYDAEMVEVYIDQQAAEIERLRSICDRRAIEINTMAEEIERLNFLYDQASNKLPARLQDFKGQIIKEWKEKCAKVADGVKCGANKDDAPTDRANDFACEYIATAIRNLPEGDE